MGNLTEESKKSNVLGRVKDSLSSEQTQKSEDKKALFADILIFAIGFVLARCHTVFGARPLGIAFVSVLPSSVWSALFGAIIGSFSLGADGLVLAAAVTVTVLLRAVASGTGCRLFSEKLSLRMAVSVVAGFITALYELVLSGVSNASLLFLLSMIILTPASVFAFSGLFLGKITPTELLSRGNFPSLKTRLKGRYERMLFASSSVFLLFLINLSLLGVDFAGISLPYIFSALVTLFVTKSFGTAVGVGVGFLITLGVAGPYSVSFALLGLGAGVMFDFGNGYAVIMGGIALSSWSIYYAGLSGFLTTLPEYLIATSLALPFLGKATVTETREADTSSADEAKDMADTVEAAYRNRYSRRLDSFSSLLLELAEHIRASSIHTMKLDREEYRNIVLDISERLCSECTGKTLCISEGIHPSVTNAEIIADKLFSKKKILPSDVNTDTEFCQIAGIVAESINCEVSRIEQEGYKRADSRDRADEYSLIAEIIRDVQGRDEGELVPDAALSSRLGVILERRGLKGGAIRIIGKRKKHFILACEDADGKKITSSELRREIEDVTGVKLSEPRFFRSGNMALMECDAEVAFKAQFFTVSKEGDKNEVSGDTAICFESSEGYFYSLISDGMGSGDLAHETSELAAGYIKSMLGFGACGDAVISLVNGALRERENECSATVDLFEFDCLTGDAVFMKCGAAPSYIKRGNSVFKIKSQTAPIGLMKNVDMDRIKANVEDGDHVIMFSDGVSDGAEDAPWLLELLCREPPENTEEYARSIIEAVPKTGGHRDDMSVTVIKVTSV